MPVHTPSLSLVSRQMPLSSGLDTAEVQPSLALVAPRRDSGIQPDSMDPSKRAVPPKPEQNIATRSSPKRQGISKNQRAKTIREKARKELRIEMQRKITERHRHLQKTLDSGLSSWFGRRCRSMHCSVNAQSLEHLRQLLGAENFRGLD